MQELASHAYTARLGLFCSGGSNFFSASLNKVKRRGETKDTAMLRSIRDEHFSAVWIDRHLQAAGHKAGSTSLMVPQPGMSVI